MVQRVRARLIQDRKEEVEGVANMIYSDKQAQGQQGQTDGFADWVEAENRVIRSTFERQAGCTMSLTSSMLVSALALQLTAHLYVQSRRNLIHVLYIGHPLQHGICALSSSLLQTALPVTSTQDSQSCV